MAYESEEILLKDVRLSFPDLFHATEYQEGDGKPRWNATFLIEPGSENDKKIKEARQKVCLRTFKEQVKVDKFLKQIENNSNRNCYRDGDSQGYDGYEEMMALATHRPAKLRNGSPNSRPAVIDRDMSHLTDEDGRPYAGCYVNAKVSIYCQTGDNSGLRASFSVVQFARDGDAFGAGAPSTDDFEDLGDGAESEDFGSEPGADDIPL